METVIGFIVGYLVGTSQGAAKLAKVRTSAEGDQDIAGAAPPRR